MLSVQCVFRYDKYLCARLLTILDKPVISVSHWTALPSVTNFFTQNCDICITVISHMNDCEEFHILSDQYNMEELY